MFKIVERDWLMNLRCTVYNFDTTNDYKIIKQNNDGEWLFFITQWKTVMSKLMTTFFRRWSISFNLRLAGGVFEHPPPCGFSRIARKRRRPAPPGFHLPYPPSFWQLLWKFRSWVMQGQVTRSGQVTIPYKSFTIAPQLQCLRESYETFGIW